MSNNAGAIYDRFLSVAASILAPGLGQVFNGRVRFGVFLFLSTAAGYLITVNIGMTLHLYSVLSAAFFDAEYVRKKRRG